jgi:hypothetical protein
MSRKQDCWRFQAKLPQLFPRQDGEDLHEPLQYQHFQRDQVKRHQRRMLWRQRLFHEDCPLPHLALPYRRHLDEQTSADRRRQHSPYQMERPHLPCHGDRCRKQLLSE